MIVQILEESMSYDDLSQWAELQSHVGYDVEMSVNEDIVTVMLENKDTKKKVLAKIETPVDDGKSKEEKSKKIKATTVVDDEGLKDIEVSVIGSHYMYNHGKKPAGKGKWAFGVGSREPKDLVFFDGVYSQVSKDAVAAAKKKAKKEGKTAVKLYVMESSHTINEFETILEYKGKSVSGKVKLDGEVVYSITGLSESVITNKLDLFIEQTEATMLSERSLSKKESKTKEKVVKGIKKSAKDMKSRYGKDWKSVAYGAATNIAKKKKLKESTEELDEDKDKVFKIYFFDKDEPKNVKSVEVIANRRQDAMDYVYYKFGPMIKIQRVQILDEATDKDSLLIAEEVQTFEIEYEAKSADGVTKGTTKYKALNASEARTRFQKDNQGKQLTIRSVKPVKSTGVTMNESSGFAMDVHDLTKLIMKEAVKFAKEKVQQKSREDDEFSRQDDAMEDAVYDYIELLQHHLEDNRDELSSMKSIQQYLGEDYEPCQYGNSKEEVIDSLIAKYLDGEDSEEVREALSDAFEAGAELGEEESEEKGSEEDVFDFDDVEDKPEDKPEPKKSLSDAVSVYANYIKSETKKY